MTIEEWLKAGRPWNVILYGDCMDLMQHLEDKSINLACVDPPYGIGKTWRKNRKGKKIETKSYKNNLIPDKEYFNELFRISQNWIIWGSNYYTKFLPASNKLICWDKQCNCITEFKSEFELAQTSITKYPSRIYHHVWSGGRKGEEIGNRMIHPHQKPVALYRWLLQNYAKPGDKVIDTHSGSGSFACAAWLEGFDFLVVEKDFDYWQSSVNRYNDLISQGRLF